ncbi:hypothetical protein L7F22_011608 [Adiantum nelumboides]|nr:hypothetical protein [Adiantum nelumboides]
MEGCVAAAHSPRGPAARTEFFQGVEFRLPSGALGGSGTFSTYIFFDKGRWGMPCSGRSQTSKGRDDGSLCTLRLGLLHSGVHSRKKDVEKDVEPGSAGFLAVAVQKILVAYYQCWSVMSARMVGWWLSLVGTCPLLAQYGQLLIRESDDAVVAAADSAPQVMGNQAEALLKLRKLDEVDSTVLPPAQRIDKALANLGITPADSFFYVL